jgi:hypothetical protein
MSNQTAVEWLVEQIKINLIAKPILENGEIKEFYLPKMQAMSELEFEAKRREKMQIVEAFENRNSEFSDPDFDGLDWYRFKYEEEL